MTFAMAVMVLLAAVCSVVLYCAVNSGSGRTRRCDGGCGRVVEPFVGVRDDSRNLYCSAACAALLAHPAT